MRDKETFDYIVVGAGSAGSVLAARLSEAQGVRVLLLEAGGDDRVLRNPAQAFENAMIRIPTGVAKAMESHRVNWGYESEIDGATGRRHVFPRGKVLGGTSSINGMIYARGQREDYDKWRDMGCVGWGWDDVAPCFRRMEANARGADQWRGGDGPVGVSDVGPILPISHAAMDACVAAGIPRNPDIWGASQEGVTTIQLTVAGGRRASSSSAYLRPASRRQNLCVRTGALVDRLVIEQGRVTGVHYVHHGHARVATAAAEVVLCGGAVASPMILERSGIGSGAFLSQLGIETRIDRPEVGENLQDHYNASLQYRLKPDVIAFTQMSRGWRAVRTALQYALTGKGLMAGSVGQVVAYARTDSALDRPDFKTLFMLVATSNGKVRGRHVLTIDPQPGITLMTCQLRPTSRGSSHITARDAAANPRIDPNFLTTEHDRQTLLAAVRKSVEIAQCQPLAGLIERPLSLPPGELDDATLFDAALRVGHPGHHLAGTCRMGTDEGAVVDPHLRVRGVDGLRVADCSIMPRLVAGNTNVPAMMIGERAADLIRACN